MRFSTLLVSIIAVAAYFFGVPLVALLVFVIIGTCIEYYWIVRRKGQKLEG